MLQIWLACRHSIAVSKWSMLGRSGKVHSTVSNYFYYNTIKQSDIFMTLCSYGVIETLLVWSATPSFGQSRIFFVPVQ